MTREEKFIRAAIAEAKKGMERNDGGPFGCIIVQDDTIVDRGNNKVTSTNDPTAHAEVVAIRDACKNLNTFQLSTCELYTSCEPCPMCLGAIYWARPKKVYYACTKQDAADADFDDSFIYRELELPFHERKIPMQQLCAEEGKVVFEAWKQKQDKTAY